MKRVEDYIKELLYTNDCVIVPEFGGFVTSYNSSEVHPIKHHFTPPSKRIAFNEKLKLNDGLLISFIANESKISLKESTELVKNFVNQTLNKFKSKEKFIIDGIGEIFKNVEGRLQFKNEVKNNYLEDSFGLPDFFAEPISRESNIKLKNKFKDRKAMSTEEIKTDQKEKKKSGGASIWILSIVAILLCCSAAFLFVLDNNESNALSSLLPSGWNSNKNVSDEVLDDTTSYEEEIVEDSVFSEEEELYNEEEFESDNVVEEEFGEIKTDEETSNFEETNVASSNEETFLNALTGRYYVITGAFGEQSNAETLRDELIVKGYNAKVLSPLGKKPLFRVSIADYESQQEGVDKATADNSEFGNTLWVMKY